jgi:hypothetical protein
MLDLPAVKGNQHGLFQAISGAFPELVEHAARHHQDAKTLRGRICGE